MAVLIEAFNVIVNDNAFSTKPEKRKLFLESIPTKAFCSDGLVYRIGFMDSQYAYQYITFLENEIELTFQDNTGVSKDIVLVDMLTGPSTECQWFRFERKKHFIKLKEYEKSTENFSIGWRIDSFEGNPDNYLVFDHNNSKESSFNFKGLCVPIDWTPDNALYETNHILNPDDELVKTGEKDGVTKFINKKTGEDTYVGTPSISTYELLENSEEFQNSIGGKIIRDEFGMCKLFGYRGNGLFNGELFSLEELTKFAINIIANEYLEANSNLSDLNYLLNNKPNFIIKSHKDIAVYIRVENGDDIGFENLKNISKNDNHYTRLTIVNFWEFNKDDWKKVKIGKNGSKDGVNPFIVNFKHHSLNTETTNRVYNKNLTHNDLLLLFEKAWSDQDASIIESYLDVNFNYFSDWVFDILPSKEEYLEYFSGKLNTLKNKSLQVACELVTDNNNQYAILFNQNEEKALFTIRTEEGRIINAKMSQIEKLNKTSDNNKVNFVPHSLTLDDRKNQTNMNDKNESWWKKLLKKYNKGANNV